MDIKKYELIIKIITIIASCLLCFISIFSLISIKILPNVILRKIIYVLFSLKIILCEFKIKKVIEIFPYMINNIGKALFIIFCGTILLDNNFGLNFILAIILIFLGIAILIISVILKKKSNINNN